MVQHLNKGESVNLHVGVALTACQGELDARHKQVHVGGKSSRQHQDEFSEQSKAALPRLDRLLFHLTVQCLHNIPHLEKAVITRSLIMFHIHSITISLTIHQEASGFLIKCPKKGF